MQMTVTVRTVDDEFPSGAQPVRLPGAMVDLPVPPDLSLALGYRGDARFVGFFWSSLGDQPISTDGVDSGTAQGSAYLAYKRHRTVAPLLEPFDLGSSDREAVHMLLIDREASRCSVASVAEARAFLERQHPPAPVLSPQQQAAFLMELDRLLDEWRERPLDHEALAREIAEQQGRVGRMMTFLDRCPSPLTPGEVIGGQK